jgi:hypothetical protein
MFEIPEDKIATLTDEIIEIPLSFEKLASAMREASERLGAAFQWNILYIPVVTRESQIRGDPRKEAEHKAEVLLMSLLNRRQKKEYKQKRQISIYEGRERKWILRKRDNYNIVECENGKPVRAYCVQTDTPLPDQLATQFLYLKHSPQELLDKANVKDYGTIKIYHLPTR